MPLDSVDVNLYKPGGFTKRLTINSKDRTFGTSSNFRKIFTQPGIRARAYQVLKIEIPHTFFNITSNNDTLYWTDDTSTAQVSSLTHGNYTTTEFLDHLGTVMTTDTLADTGTATYTASVNTITGKITITNNLLANFSIEWSTDTVSQRLAYDLGFTPVQNIGDVGAPVVVDSTGAATYTANNTYWIGVPKNINIKSNLTRYALTNSNVATARGGGTFDILEQVLVNTVEGDITVYEPQYPIIVPMSLNNIFELDFQLLDSEYNGLDLNGRDWNIIINFHDPF